MKKKLLEESQIRRMMKFANIGSLSDGFVGRINEQDEMEAPEEGGEDEMDLGGEDEMGLGGDEEAGDEVLDAVSDLVDSVKDFVRRASKDQSAADMISQEREGEEGAEGEEDMEGPMDDPMGDEPMGDDAEADAGPTVSIDVEKLVSDIVAALNAQGADVSVDDGAPADDAPLDDAPMDDAPMDDAPLGDDPMEEEFVAEETVSEEETLEEEAVEEDLVNEITRRVAQRILQNASN